MTYDGQSFMLDGRRIWIVSGSINYARIPREDWADRIHAAKLAGLNTIETSIVWARHEPVAGQFDFKGDNDLRHFVELIKGAGLYCILRPGPYIGQGFDMGGMPPWLAQINDIKFRTTNQPFLEATSRYITEVARQVRDLQVTSPGEGGPIILVQSESGWTCGDDDLGQAYLGEIDRYLREAGFTVPTINANDLWQGAEGEIDCWRGFDDLLAHLRQLGAVNPDRPRLLIEFTLGEIDLWGRPLQRTRTPAMIMRRLTEALAAGAQFNVMPFCGGTYFGFSAGRTLDGALGDGFLTTSADGGGPIDEAGAASPAYHAVRRIATFASSFARLLANVDTKRPGVALAPGSTAGGSLSVVHAAGPQGSVAFLFGDETGKKRSQKCDLLLPDGTSLPVDLGTAPVGWCLFDTRLTARAHLDFCNLSVLGFEGQMLVCFGAGGSTGYLSINDSTLEVEVPRGKTPVVAQHEGITVIVVNDDQVAPTYFGGKGVFAGVAGVTRDGGPVFEPGAKQATLIEEGGTTKTIKPGNGAAATGGAGGGGGGHKRGGRLNITGWTRAGMASYTDGSSARFANIPGPADLMKLGAPYGYGWYRVTFPCSRPHRPHVMLPQAADRLHLWHNGQSAGIVGTGPGAVPETTLQLAKADQTLVALAEVFGRWSDGPDLGGKHGWCGHAWAVTTFRIGKAKIEEGPLVEPLSFRTPLWRLHRGDVTNPERLTWTFTHRKKSPIIIDLSRLVRRGLVLLNDKAIHYFDRGAGGRIILDQEQLNRGKNSFQVALIGASTAEHAAEITKAVSFHEGVECLTEQAQWAFAKWEEPGANAFDTVQKKDLGTGGRAGPTWWRGSFTPDASGRGLVLEATGMSKGQIYINDRHLGRYFVAAPTARGMTAVGPQINYHVPRSWLRADEPNEIVLFDEHGGNPSRCKLAYENGGSPTRG
jgi:hypothetical protein